MFNLSLKGFKWDATNGGADPADTALGTMTKWDKGMAEDKNLKEQDLGWQLCFEKKAYMANLLFG